MLVIYYVTNCLYPDAMLQALKELQPELTPVSLMTDFEKCAIRAFQEAFSGLNYTGKLFHLSQSV